MATIEDHQAAHAGEHTTSDRFPAPTAGGSQGSTLVLAVGAFRDWLDEYMIAHELPPLTSRGASGVTSRWSVAGSESVAATGAPNPPTGS
jgi:hypothetical protein